jgi:hypothetical protein
MNADTAFRKLVSMAMTSIQSRDKVHTMGVLSLESERRRNEKIKALLIGADYIAQMSGCFPREEQIWNTCPISYQRLMRYKEQEGVYK